MNGPVFALELLPTRSQSRAMTHAQGCCRFIWNKALAARRECYELTGERPGHHDLLHAVAVWRDKPEMRWLNKAPYVPLVQTLWDQRRAFFDFYLQVADLPAKRQRWQGHGFRYYGEDQFSLKPWRSGSTVFLPMAGLVKIKDGVEVMRTPISVTVAGKGRRWFAIFYDRAGKPCVISKPLLIVKLPGATKKARVGLPAEFTLPWFDAGAFLSTLGPRINRPWLMNGKPIFKCFSMPNGAVYVWVDVVWETAAAMAAQSGDPTLNLCGVDERDKRHGILLAITRALRKHGAVIDSLMGDRFFKNDFDIAFKDGRATPKRAMVPLKADAFGVMVSALEARKTDELIQVEAVALHLSDGVNIAKTGEDGQIPLLNVASAKDGDHERN